MSQTVNWCYLEIPFRKPGFQQLSSLQLRCRLTPIAIWAVSPTWGWQYICWRFIRALCGLATSYGIADIETYWIFWSWHGMTWVTTSYPAPHDMGYICWFGPNPTSKVLQSHIHIKFLKGHTDLPPVVAASHALVSLHERLSESRSQPIHLQSMVLEWGNQFG